MQISLQSANYLHNCINYNTTFLYITVDGRFCLKIYKNDSLKRIKIVFEVGFTFFKHFFWKLNKNNILITLKQIILPKLKPKEKKIITILISYNTFFIHTKCINNFTLLSTKYQTWKMYNFKLYTIRILETSNFLQFLKLK